MAMVFGSGAAPLPVTYLFVDGANLANALAGLSKLYFSGRPVELDWSRLRGPHRKAFYYDAVPVQSEKEDDQTYSARVAPKRAELSAIERQPHWHVRSGDVRHRKGRGNEQKMVDVQLAVDALLMASRGLFSGATIITGDLDFKPLVTALVEMGVDVELIYPSKGGSQELLAAADTVKRITSELLQSWAAPQDFGVEFPNSTGIPPWDPAKFAAEAILDLTDTKLGRTLVLPHPNGWEIRTEYGFQRGYGGISLDGPDATMLRAFAEDMLEIAIPEW